MLQIQDELEIYGNCLLIHCDEDLDHHYAKKLRERADKLLDTKDIQHIIFDFSSIAFMDSSGIGFIMGRYRKVLFRGGKVALAGIHSELDRIFTVSGLYKIMERYDNAELALQALNK